MILKRLTSEKSHDIDMSLHPSTILHSLPIVWIDLPQSVDGGRYLDMYGFGYIKHGVYENCIFQWVIAVCSELVNVPDVASPSTAL